MWWVTSGVGSSRPAAISDSTESRWPITFAWPPTTVTFLNQMRPRCTSARSAWTPTIDSVPALRRSLTARSTTAALPTASTATSTPRPSVASFTAARGSSSVACTGSAPSERATSRRSGTVSMAITRAAPATRAAIAAQRPTGPRPMIAQVSPGWSPALTIAW